LNLHVSYLRGFLGPSWGHLGGLLGALFGQNIVLRSSKRPENPAWTTFFAPLTLLYYFFSAPDPSWSPPEGLRDPLRSHLGPRTCPESPRRPQNSPREVAKSHPFGPKWHQKKSLSMEVPPDDRAGTMLQDAQLLADALRHPSQVQRDEPRHSRRGAFSLARSAPIVPLSRSHLFSGALLRRTAFFRAPRLQVRPLRFLHEV